MWSGSPLGFQPLCKATLQAFVAHSVGRRLILKLFTWPNNLHLSITVNQTDVYAAKAARFLQRFLGAGIALQHYIIVLALMMLMAGFQRSNQLQQPAAARDPGNKIVSCHVQCCLAGFVHVL